MSAGPDDRSTLVYALDTLGPIRDEIERSPGATIRPQSPETDDAGQRAIEALMRAAQRERTVTLGSTLGQGGMGVVHLAEQVALGRTVAVKRLRDGLGGQAHVLSLMREAWVTGRLEHPNVVPIHDVGLDADGLPFLVMKRIEGEEWGDLIGDPDTVRERFGVHDVTAWHLGVLVSVCNAIAFAHDRGVIHRDLKPDNVMIGAFGEVYVLDWGIALSLVDDGSGRMPLASRATRLAGTPAYMAPEMLRGGPLGTWTDVYLLGGLLYELLAGRPPHHGRTVEALAREIEASRPPAPEGPAELVELCLAALDPDPARRPASALELRTAVQRHLEHRGAMRLADEASESLARLRELLDGAEASSDQLWNLFGEIRFGYRQALRAWPEHPDAIRGLDEAVQHMARRELAQGDPSGAARLIAEDPITDDGLVAIVQREVRRAERAAVLADRVAGVRTRWFVGVLLGVIWTLFSGGLYWFQPAPSLERHLGADAGFLVLIVGLGVWARDSLSRTSLNRRAILTLALVPVSQAALAIGVFNLGQPMLLVDTLQIFLWACLAVMVTLVLEPRFAPAALAFSAGWIGATLLPSHALGFAALGNAVLTANIAYVWRPPPGYVPLHQREAPRHGAS